MYTQPLKIILNIWKNKSTTDKNFMYIIHRA